MTLHDKLGGKCPCVQTSGVRLRVQQNTGFPEIANCKLLAMALKKLYNSTHAVRPQAVVQVLSHLCRLAELLPSVSCRIFCFPSLLYQMVRKQQGEFLRLENFGIESGLTRPTACPTIRVDEMMRGSSTTSHLFSHCEGVAKKRASGQRMLSFLHVTSKLAAWVSVTRPA